MIAVVGVTGMVGEKMLTVLQERRFPVENLVPVASRASGGKTVRFNGISVPVVSLTPAVFSGVDIALFSAGAEVSREFAPIAVRQGAVVIDNSSAWRMDPEVPLVVPEVNPHALRLHHGKIANPNCSTIQLVTAIAPLHREFGIERIVIATYQSVSGSGRAAMQQLQEEIAGDVSRVQAYPHPIAFNCLPHIDVFSDDGYSKEEHKLMDETRKIFEDKSIGITATCVRVPVKIGHSESVNLQLRKSFTLEEIIELLTAAPGVTVQDDPGNNVYPIPIRCEGSDEVFVGRIRRDSTVENGLNLWIVADNLRKGAATNAVQIAEALIKTREGLRV